MTLRTLPICLTFLSMCCGTAVHAESSADLSSARAILSLADELYEDGQVARSVLALNKAAEMDLPDAQAELGMKLAAGVDVPRDLARAEELLRLAVRNGKPAYARELACVLYKRRGAAHLEEAAKLMSGAALGGDPLAMAHMSRFYRFGVGVARDEMEANLQLKTLFKRLYISPLGQSPASRDIKFWLSAIFLSPGCGPEDLVASYAAELLNFAYNDHHSDAAPAQVSPRPPLLFASSLLR